MKKILFAFSLVALLAAGCNPSQPLTAPTATQITKNENSASSTTPIPSQNPTTTPKILNPGQTGWKTYKNSKFGLEFQYPPSGVLTEYDLTDQAPYGDAPFCPNKPDLPGCLDLIVKFTDGSEFNYTYQTREMGRDLMDNIITKKVLVGSKEYNMHVDKLGNAFVHKDQETSIAFFDNPSTTDLSLFKNILSTFKFKKNLFKR